MEVVCLRMGAAGCQTAAGLLPLYPLQPAGGIVRNLGQFAPKLVNFGDSMAEDGTNALYKVLRNDGDQDFWISVDGQAMDRVNFWLNMRERQLETLGRNTIKEPLFINGMIKVCISDRRVRNT